MGQPKNSVIKEYVDTHPIVAALIVAVLCIGLSIAASFIVVFSIIGSNHEYSSAFEQKCVEAKGTLFESRQSGICYSTNGTILFSTGSGGFSNFH